MSWHYRARHQYYKGQHWFDVVEYYEGDSESGPMWTTDGIRPGGETLLALADELRRMLRDIEIHPIMGIHREGEEE